MQTYQSAAPGSETAFELHRRKAQYRLPESTGRVHGQRGLTLVNMAREANTGVQNDVRVGRDAES